VNIHTVIECVGKFKVILSAVHVDLCDFTRMTPDIQIKQV